MSRSTGRSNRSAWYLALAGGVAIASAFAPLTASRRTAPPTVPDTFETRRLSDWHIRDACVLADSASHTYYMTVPMGMLERRRGTGVQMLTSEDLIHWTGPYTVFEAGPGFWAHRGVWAPEIHVYGGRYYLFATFNTNDSLPDQREDWPPRVKRGTQVLWADTPLGPYRAFDTTRSTLDPKLMTLDGTFWVEGGVPYMVYSHEWVQIGDGAMEMIRLTDDLSATVGDPTTLFHASEAPWVTPSTSHPGSWVTDGPYLYRTRTGKLLMIWSSFGTGGYMTGIAESESGKLRGPWKQQDKPLFARDGGHGMIFRAFDGRLVLVLHRFNNSGREREQLWELDDTGGTLVLEQRID